MGNAAYTEFSSFINASEIEKMNKNFPSVPRKPALPQEQNRTDSFLIIQSFMVINIKKLKTKIPH